MFNSTLIGIAPAPTREVSAVILSSDEAPESSDPFNSPQRAITRGSIPVDSKPITPRSSPVKKALNTKGGRNMLASVIRTRLRYKEPGRLSPRI